MDYFILKHSTHNLEDPAKIVSAWSKADGCDEHLRFNEGSRIEKQLPVLQYIQEDQGNLGDLVQAGAYDLVVSEKLKKTLDEAGIINIDYYPLEIYERPEDEWLKGFYMANILTVVSCVDLEKSIFTPAFHIADHFHNEIFSFEVLRLDYDRLSGKKIFRLQEMISLILVNEEVKEILEKADVRGLAFASAEGYKD